MLSWAAAAGPPSPEKPGRELPATSVSVPLEEILKTALPLLKYTLPLASVVTRFTVPIAVLAAAAGVVGGAPPATVEIE